MSTQSEATFVPWAERGEGGGFLPWKYEPQIKMFNCRGFILLIPCNELCMRSFIHEACRNLWYVCKTLLVTGNTEAEQETVEVLNNPWHEWRTDLYRPC